MVKLASSLNVLSARDLRLRGGELLSEAEAGRLSLITKRGRPAAVAVPFDEQLLELGIHRALALRLVEEGGASLPQAARIAGLSLEEFLVLLAEAGVAAVDYDPAELDTELAVAR